MTRKEHEAPTRESLLVRITTRRAVVGVIGLGYVGLPLAVEFASAGYSVIGFDIDQGRVAELNDGISPIPDVDAAALGSLIAAGQLRATSDFDTLAEVDTISICVPTP